MDRLVHVSQTALFFCPASLALSVSSIPSKYKEGKKKKGVSEWELWELSPFDDWLKTS